MCLFGCSIHANDRSWNASRFPEGVQNQKVFKKVVHNDRSGNSGNDEYSGIQSKTAWEATERNLRAPSTRMPRKPQKRFRKAVRVVHGNITQTTKQIARNTPIKHKTPRRGMFIHPTKMHQRSPNVPPRRPSRWSNLFSVFADQPTYLLGSSGSWSAIQPSTVGTPAFLRQICQPWVWGGGRGSGLPTKYFSLRVGMVESFCV